MDGRLSTQTKPNPNHQKRIKMKGQKLKHDESHPSRWKLETGKRRGCGPLPYLRSSASSHPPSSWEQEFYLKMMILMMMMKFS